MGFTVYCEDKKGRRMVKCEYTANYNLKKPEGTDIVNIDDLNENADIIDQKLKELEDGVNSAPPNSVNDLAIGTAHQTKLRFRQVRERVH